MDDLAKYYSELCLQRDDLIDRIDVIERMLRAGDDLARHGLKITAKTQQAGAGAGQMVCQIVPDDTAKAKSDMPPQPYVDAEPVFPPVPLPGPAKKRPWTAEDDRALMQADNVGMSDFQIAAGLCRTERSVQNRRAKLATTFKTLRSADQPEQKPDPVESPVAVALALSPENFPEADRSRHELLNQLQAGSGWVNDDDITLARLRRSNQTFAAIAGEMLRSVADVEERFKALRLTNTDPESPHIFRVLRDREKALTG